jgi:hypothetical protein
MAYFFHQKEVFFLQSEVRIIPIKYHGLTAEVDKRHKSCLLSRVGGFHGIPLGAPRAAKG